MKKVDRTDKKYFKITIDNIYIMWYNGFISNRFGDIYGNFKMDCNYFFIAGVHIDSNFNTFFKYLR